MNPDRVVREEIRTKIKEILQKHGVAPDEIGMARESRLQREELLLLFDRCGFEVREIPFEFAVTLESRREWRRISVFSEGRWWDWAEAESLDPEVRKEIREAIDEWRKRNVESDRLTSRWRLLVAHPIPGWSPQ